MRILGIQRSIAVALVATGLALAASSASAAPLGGECRYVEHPPAGPRGNALLITRDEQVTLRRDGEEVSVYVPSMRSPLGCAGQQATTHSIDRIEFRPLASRDLVVDETTGRFEPGASTEKGGSEIEIVAVLPLRAYGVHLPPKLRVIGTSGPDQMRIGRRDKEMTAINVAVRRDGRYKDADILTFSPRPSLYTLDGGAGDDRLGSSGRGAELDGPLPERQVFVRAGDGDDRVFAGPRRDIVQAKDGGDTIYSRGGDDSIQVSGGGNRVIAARGADLIQADSGDSPGENGGFYSGGPGKDEIHAENGQVDLIGCGSAIDHVWVDPVDLWDRGTCERPHGRGLD